MHLHLTFITIYLAFWFTILGSVLGSFLDCMAWRRKEGESIWRGRSHCGSCGHPLKVRDLVPVFSFLLAKGTCRYCKAKIPKDALAAELAGAFTFGALTLKLGPGTELAMWLIFAGLLLLLSLIDYMEQILPDRILLLAVINRAAFWFLSGALADTSVQTLLMGLAGALAVPAGLLLVVLLMDRILQKETMGGGDIKLLAVLGLYLNWMQMLLLLLTACILGILGALFMKKDNGQAIPFGPFLAVGTILVVLWGQPVLNWYTGLF